MATIRTMKVEAITWIGQGYYWGMTTFKTFIDDKGNETYYVNDKEVSAEEGNEYYLNLKRENKDYQQSDDCKKYIKRQWARFYRNREKDADSYTLHEKDTWKVKVEQEDVSYEELIERYERSIDRYMQYIDNGKQYEQACRHNDKMRERIRKLYELIAERD